MLDRLVAAGNDTRNGRKRSRRHRGVWRLGWGRWCDDGHGRRDGWHGRDDDWRRWQHDGRRRRRGHWRNLDDWRRRRDRWRRWRRCGNGAGRGEWIEQRKRRRHGGWQRRRRRRGQQRRHEWRRWRASRRRRRPVIHSGLRQDHHATRIRRTQQTMSIGRDDPLLPAQRPEQRRQQDAAAAGLRLARLRHEQRLGRRPVRLHLAIRQQGHHRVAAGRGSSARQHLPLGRRGPQIDLDRQRRELHLHPDADDRYREPTTASTRVACSSPGSAWAGCSPTPWPAPTTTGSAASRPSKVAARLLRERQRQARRHHPSRDRRHHRSTPASRRADARLLDSSRTGATQTTTSIFTGCTSYGACAQPVVYCVGNWDHTVSSTAKANIWKFFNSLK